MSYTRRHKQLSSKWRRWLYRIRQMSLERQTSKHSVSTKWKFPRDSQTGQIDQHRLYSPKDYIGPCRLVVCYQVDNPGSNQPWCSLEDPMPRHWSTTRRCLDSVDPRLSNSKLHHLQKPAHTKSYLREPFVDRFRSRSRTY